VCDDGRVGRRSQRGICWGETRARTYVVHARGTAAGKTGKRVGGRVVWCAHTRRVRETDTQYYDGGGGGGGGENDTQTPFSSPSRNA